MEQEIHFDEYLGWQSIGGRRDLLLAGKSIKNLSVRKRAKDIARVFQDPKMGTASRLTIEENMAIALRRGQKRGLGWGVKEKDRIQFQEALKGVEYWS